MEMLICNKLLLWCINYFADPSLKRGILHKRAKKNLRTHVQAGSNSLDGSETQGNCFAKLLITQQQ
jgi:hypothetical protein